MYFAHGRTPAIPEMFIILATMESGFWNFWFIRFAKTWEVSIEAVRLRSRTFLACSKVTSSSGCLEKSAAEFMSTCGVPISSARSKRFCICLGSVRSAGTAMASGPSFFICETMSSAFDLFL